MVTVNDYMPDTQGGGIGEIVIDAGKTEAAIKAKEVIDEIDQTGFLSNQLTSQDLKNLGQALADGDTDKATSIFYNEVSQLQDNAPSAVLSALGVLDNPLGNFVTSANLANSAVQKFADLSGMVSGVDIPGDNILSSGIEGALDFVDKPIQIGANLFGQGVTGLSSDYNQFLQNLYNLQPVQTASNVIKYPFDILYNIDLPGITSLNPFKKKDKTVQLTNDQINQIVEDEINLGGGSTPPPVVVTDTQKPYESGVGQQTGQTGGPAGMGFAPPPPAPAPTVGTSGMTYQDVINRADGGLATIPRYLKGR
jgi:hypothetical protein